MLGETHGFCQSTAVYKCPQALQLYCEGFRACLTTMARAAPRLLNGCAKEICPEILGIKEGCQGMDFANREPPDMED